MLFLEILFVKNPFFITINILNVNYNYYENCIKKKYINFFFLDKKTNPIKLKKQ